MLDPRLQVFSLSLIMSCSCNLSCEYCWIAASKKNKEKADQLQQKTIEALKDGTFLKNTVASLERLDLDPKEIRNFSFWGQEPTLTLEYFTQNLQDWFTAFPKLFRFEFSTNGMAKAKEIVEFIAALEKYGKERISLSVQFSYDGEYSTNNIRKASSEIIKKNIIYVFEECNKLNLQKVHVDFCVHAVCSVDMMRRLDTDEKLYNYYKEMDEFMHEVRTHINHPALYLGPQISLNLENPHQSSRADGEYLTEFIKRSNALDYSDFYHKQSPANDFLGMPAESIRWIRNDGYQDQLESLKEFYLTNECQREQVGHLFCGNNVEELKIMYDGTLINCQNYMFDKEMENIPDDGVLYNEVKKSLVKKHYYANALTDSKEDLKKNIKMFLDLKFEGQPFVLNYIYNMMYVLALTGQIHESYLTDKNKFLRHGYMISLNNNCAYNHLVETGSHYLKGTGYIRRYCNGVLDLLDEFINNQEKLNGKMPDQMGVLPWEREVMEGAYGRDFED